MLAQPPLPQLAGNPAADPAADPASAWLAAMRRADLQAAWAVSDRVLAARDPATRDDPTQPYHQRWVWDGRPFAGRRVLVRCYHGLGDTLQFSRYLAPLRRVVAHLTLEVQPELLPLLALLPGPDVLHPFDPADPLPPSECDIEVMELAHALRLSPDPAPLLRLRPDAGHPAPSGGVGLCWQAGGWDPDRSMPAAALAPLLGHIRPISLQRGPAAADAALLGAADPLAGAMAMLPTARLIAGLDAVVTVDTMVVHLAGLLGCPTVVLLKTEPDWRWHAGAEGPGPLGRSIWYDSVRMARQTRPGDWRSAIERVLRHWAADEPATLQRRGGS